MIAKVGRVVRCPFRFSTVRLRPMDHCPWTDMANGSRLLADVDWVAIKSIVAGVRREGSWKAYCRVEHKRLLRLMSYLVRGYAETTDARVDRILRLPNGACWTVLAYWREAA